MTDLSAIRRGIRTEQIQDFTRAILILDLQRGNIQAACLVDNPGPMGLGDEHHVEIVRERHPMAIRPMVEVVIGAGAQIDVRDHAVDRMETIVSRQVKVRAPPRLRLLPPTRLPARLQPSLPAG